MASVSEKTEQPKILLVDDNDELRQAMGAMLGANNFQVTTATSAAEALHLIDTKPFDVLLTDLHMLEAGDAFTVVSAMRHTNPNAVTSVFSGYSALQEAADAILSQADHVLLKPIPPPALIAIIRRRLEKRELRTMTDTERVPSIVPPDSLLAGVGGRTKRSAAASRRLPPN